MSSPVALRCFLLLLLEAPPFISGMKLLHDGAVAKYPMASVSLVKKSAPNLSIACNRPCFHSQYTVRILQYNIWRYPNFVSILSNAGLQINAFCKRTVETLTNTDAVSQ